MIQILAIIGMIVLPVAFYLFLKFESEKHNQRIRDQINQELNQSNMLFKAYHH